MSINPKIFQSINELEVKNKKIKNFLIELLKYETTNPGWYKDKYRSLIEEYSGGNGDKNEN